MATKFLTVWCLAALLLQLVTTLPVKFELLEIEGSGPALTRVKRQQPGQTGVAGSTTTPISNLGDKAEKSLVINYRAPDNLQGKNEPNKKEEDTSKNDGATDVKTDDGVTQVTTTAPKVEDTMKAKHQDILSQLKALAMGGTDGFGPDDFIFINTDDLEQGPEDSTAEDDEDDDDDDDDDFNKCARVRCTQPSKEVECKEVEHPPSELIKFTNSQCCPIHACRRQDGSTFFHYAIEIDDEPVTVPTSPPPPQKWEQAFSFSFPAAQNSKNMAAPPHSVNVPPFLSSIFKPILPFLPSPPPSTFYSAERRGAPWPLGTLSSSQTTRPTSPPTLLNGLLFPSFSAGASHPSSTSATFQIFQSPPTNKYSSAATSSFHSFPQHSSSDSSTAMSRFDSGLFGPDPNFDGWARYRRNAFSPFFGAGAPAGFMPNRPGAFPLNGFPMMLH